MNETQRDQVTELLAKELPGAAMAKYQGHLDQFATECPEFLFWTNVYGRGARTPVDRHFRVTCQGRNTGLTSMCGRGHPARVEATTRSRLVRVRRPGPHGVRQ